MHTAKIAARNHRGTIALRSVAVAVAATSGYLAVAAASPSLALAQGSCYWDGQSHFDGAMSNNGTWSNRAWITTQNAWPCNGGGTNQGATMWSLVEGSNPGGSPNPYEYAQTGYLVRMVNGSPTPYYFAEYNDGTTIWDPNHWYEKEFSQAPIGGNHEYQEFYDSGHGSMNMWGDNNLLLWTPWNPTSVWSGPWRPQYFGEVHDWHSDMPGNSSYRTHVTYEQVINSSPGGSWTSTPGVFASNDYPGVWAVDTITATSHNVYTACGSCYP